MNERPVSTGRLTPEELTAMVSQAKEHEARRPKWIILAGFHSRQYVAFYRPAGGWVARYTLAALDKAMQETEDWHARRQRAQQRADASRPEARVTAAQYAAAPEFRRTA